ANIAELINVCGAEATEVVAAFRSDGFLTPQESLVDIIHECILREWPKLQSWLEQEERNAKRLRELAEAAKDGGWPRGLGGGRQQSMRGLQGLTLETLVVWREEVRPTAAWAGGYVTAAEFHTADSYLTWSLALDEQQKARVRDLELQAVQTAKEKLRRTRVL